MENTKTIGFLGVGAIGSVMAATLQYNKNYQFQYFTRSPKSAIHIQIGQQKHSFEIQCGTKRKEILAMDWLIVCLKEYHFEAAKQDLKRLVPFARKVAVVRNGLYLKQPFLALAKEENILECMIDCPTQMNGFGAYESLYKPIITVPKSDLSNSFAKLFAAETAKIIQRSDFKTASWEKLIESAALGAVLALSGETCWIFKDEKMVDLYRQMATEGIAVAKADGAKMENGFLEKLLRKLKNYPPTKGSSMLTDRKNGRRIELQAKNGMIAFLGKKYGIPTPLNDWACTLLKYTNKYEN